MAKKSAATTQVSPIVTSQPEINIGLVGHVDHGKTTLTERLSGKWTDTHSEELKRGITIKLGYADTVIYQKKDKTLTTKEKDEDGTTHTPVRKISLIDAPGHESLMATMLSGAALMDGALLLVSANERCPQPQTREHLMALEICGIKNIIIVQNKIDMVPKEKAMQNFEQIKEFVKGSIAENAPIIPISARFGINIDKLLGAIQNVVPTPVHDSSKDPIMFVARSFDVNRPGAVPEKLVGGILGGALMQGKLVVGDSIELRPGRRVEKEGKVNYVPIATKIIGLKTGGMDVQEVIPGGSIGVMTSLDPSVVKGDSLVGSLAGHSGKLPPIWNKLTLETHLLERVVGTKEDLNVEAIKLAEPLMLNCNSSATVGVVTALGKNQFTCTLKLPICADLGARVTISRRVGSRFRLIGYGILKG